MFKVIVDIITQKDSFGFIRHLIYQSSVKPQLPWCTSNLSPRTSRPKPPSESCSPQGCGRPSARCAPAWRTRCRPSPTGTGPRPGHSSSAYWWRCWWAATSTLCTAPCASSQVRLPPPPRLQLFVPIYSSTLMLGGTRPCSFQTLLLSDDCGDPNSWLPHRTDGCHYFVTATNLLFVLRCEEFTREVTDTQMPLVAPVILPEMYKIFTMAEVRPNKPSPYIYI